VARRTHRSAGLGPCLAIALAGAVAAGSGRAAAAEAAPGSLGTGLLSTTLDNGLRLVVEERPDTETVALRLVLLGGALEAPLDRRSLAGLHASLVVRSTLDHKADALARAVEALGGRLSAGASLRAETIAFDGPAESLEPAMGLLGEVLLKPRLDAYELEKEKGLLAGSIASSRDVPSTELLDETYRALFKGHPFERLVQPAEAEVRAVTIDEVRRFHAARFGAGRIVLVVVGKCASAEVVRIAGHAFEALAAAPRASPDPVPLPAPAPLRSDVHRDVHRRTTQSEIVIAMPMDGISEEDLPAYVLLRHILGGFQERLYAEIREKRGFAYWIALRGFAMPSAGWLGVHTGAEKKNLPAIEQVVRAELARIAKEPVGAEELDRARRYMTTVEARVDETNGGRASALVATLLDRRPFRTYEDSVARLAAVTPEQIRDLARRLFDGRHVAVVTMP
jgi:zinc protease